MTELTDLTDKQRRFVEEYLLDLNATQAAIRAGYSKKTADVQGPRLLGNVRVAAAIAEGKGERTERTEINQDFVVRGLRENYERAMQAQAVYGRGGEKTGVYRYDGPVANKALELLGKHLGMFTDKIEHSGGVTVELIETYPEEAES